MVLGTTLPLTSPSPTLNEEPPKEPTEYYLLDDDVIGGALK